MGVDDIFLGFAISYLAGSVPSLKELFKKGEDLTVQERMCKSYEKALKKWCANDNIRKRMARQWFNDLDQLKADGSCRKGTDMTALKDLAGMWADEMRKDEVLAHYFIEDGIKKIGDRLDRLDELIREREKKEEPHQIKRGLKVHKPVEGYIRRYCNAEKSENNFLYYALNLRQRHCLAEYVTGTLETNHNKFILYSSAQTGKTTELKQLCWELQQSGLFIPVMLEVRNNTQLKRDDLPDFRFIAGKEVVIVIDALDEVNGKKYEDLLEEIRGYAYDHPEIKTVLSCRSNYRRERQLDLFCELYLEELSSEDVREHINKELGKSNGLLSFIGENNLTEFVRNPFFLNVLIGAYKDNCKRLPKNKAEVYRLFIEKSYKTETKEKNVLTIEKHSFEDSVKLLERVALALSLMNVQTLVYEELKKCLDNNESNVTECLRYDLLRNEGGHFSFKYNAFREWLVANYLYREGIEKAKQLAQHPNGRIKPEWYNIVVLWVSMYGNTDVEDVKSILTWLQKASLELVIYIDKGMIDEGVRDSIFRGILLEYKSLGIRMSNILAQDYKNLLDFAQSNESVRFIIDELRDASLGTAYYADLMCLCFFLKWEVLEQNNHELVEELFQMLLSKTREALNEAPKHDISLLYFDIEFFANKEYLERIFAVVGTSDHYEAIRSMFQLIGEADAADEYLDWMLEKEHLVCNQHEGNTTHIISRSAVYSALGKVKSLDGVKKVLAHTFKNSRSFYQDEWNEYSKMMKAILGRAAEFIKEGNSEQVNDLEKYYVNTFKDYCLMFDRDKNSQELLQLIRQSYLDAGCAERGRKQFYDDLNVIFSPRHNVCESEVNVQKTFSMAALWITCEDVKADFGKFSATNGYDRAKAGWYREIPLAEVANCARQLYKEVFPEPEVVVKQCERQKNSFDDFADYNVFKQVVLEMVSHLKDGMTRKEYRQKLEEINSGYNQYALRFVSNFVDRDNGYDLNAIVQGIKDRDKYEAFFMNEISQLMAYPNPNITITDELKKRCVNCAKNIVVRLCKGDRVYYSKVAVGLLLNGCFEISDNLLPDLLGIADYSVTKKDIDDFYSNEYFLFDYIIARVEYDVIAPIIVKRLQAIINNDCQLTYLFSKYIVENRVEKGYHLALQYAISVKAWSGNVLELLIKNRIQIEKIKTAIKPLATADKLLVYETFVRELGDVVWVRQQLEAEYKTCGGYALKRALRLLTSIGSLDALGYLVVNTSLITDGDDFHFNYDNPNAISDLCYFIQFCKEKLFDGPFMLTTILASLERIAVKDEDSLNEVKLYLRGLTQKGNQYKYLNRHILAFEDKYYASYSGISDINKVIELIDSCAPIETNISSVAKEDECDEVEEVLYISYNWESNSQQLVDHFCFVLETEKIGYKRDKKDCGYRNNIKEFMNAIRAGKTIMVVFSRAYLKSKYCMYELSGIMEDPAFEDRIMPVVMDDTLRGADFYKELLLYWKQKLDEQQQLVADLKDIDQDKAEPEEEELREIKATYDVLPTVRKYLKWTVTENLESLSFTHFKTIVDKIKEDRKKDNDIPSKQNHSNKLPIHNTK